MGYSSGFYHSASSNVPGWEIPDQLYSHVWNTGGHQCLMCVAKTICKIVGETNPDFGFFKTTCLLGKILMSFRKRWCNPSFLLLKSFNFVCWTPSKSPYWSVNCQFPRPCLGRTCQEGTSVNCKSITSRWRFGPQPWDFLTKLIGNTLAILKLETNRCEQIRKRISVFPGKSFYKMVSSIWKRNKCNLQKMNLSCKLWEFMGSNGGWICKMTSSDIINTH